MTDLREIKPNEPTNRADTSQQAAEGQGAADCAAARVATATAPATAWHGEMMMRTLSRGLVLTDTSYCVYSCICISLLMQKVL